MLKANFLCNLLTFRANKGDSATILFVVVKYTVDISKDEENN